MTKPSSRPQLSQKLARAAALSAAAPAYPPTSAFAVERHLIAGIVLALGVLVALLCAPAGTSADEPGYGLARCDSPDALKYRDSETPIPTGHVLSDGTPVCHTAISRPGPAPYSQAQIRESARPPSVESLNEYAREQFDQEMEGDPDYIPYQRATNAPPVPHDEWDNYDFFNPGLRGTCGGMYAPRDVGWNELRLGYLCDRNTDRWVKIIYARVAADHEMIWYPPDPCARQKHGTDPFRDELVTVRNDDFSEEACRLHLETLLTEEFAARKAAADGGKPDPYCLLIGVNTIFMDDEGNRTFAYGQVFHGQPDDEGNCLSTPVFWGTYTGAVNFMASDARCGGGGAVGTWASGTSVGKSVASSQLRSKQSSTAQSNTRTPRNQVRGNADSQVADQVSNSNSQSSTTNAPVANTPPATKEPPASTPSPNDPIDYSSDASDPCDQSFQVPGSYVPGQGCASQ